jgi:hypothetical protein
MVIVPLATQLRVVEAGLAEPGLQRLTGLGGQGHDDHRHCRAPHHEEAEPGAPLWANDDRDRAEDGQGKQNDDRVDDERVPGDTIDEIKHGASVPAGICRQPEDWM